MKLSTALCLYVLGVCCLIFMGITYVMERDLASAEQKQASKITRLLQVDMANDIDNELRGMERAVRRSASQLKLYADGADREKASLIIRTMLEADSNIRGGAVAFVPGVSLADSTKWMLYLQWTNGGITEEQLANTGYDYPNMPWFADALAKEDGIWSAPYLDTGAGDCLMSTFSVPAVDSNGVAYAVVTADVALVTLEREMHSLRPFPTSQSYLTDTSGSPIAGMPIPDIDTTGCIHSMSDITPLGLRINTFTPASDTMPRDLQPLKLEILIIIAIGFLVLAIMVRFLFLYVSKPLDKLSKAAINIGQGHFDTPLPATGRYSDLNRLHNAMATMERSISKYVDQIARNARERQRIDSELEIASDIQRGMLPKPAPIQGFDIGGKKVEVDALLKPALEVSGDLYLYFPVAGKLCFCIADVSGKGIPASLLMVSFKERLQMMAEAGNSPAEILATINNTLCDNNPRNMFVTALVALLDPVARRLTIANAGHNPPLLTIDGETEYLRLLPSLPVGVMPDTVYQESEIPFPDGSRILFYTDGITEAENREGEQFGEERLLDAENHATCIADLLETVNEFDNGKQTDDVTLLRVTTPRQCYDLTIPCLTDRIGEAMALARHFARENNLSPQTAYRLELIVEEWITNVVNHSDSPEVKLSIKPEGQGAVVTVENKGPRFNPLEQAPDVDVNAPADMRPVGGLGIFLIRETARDIEYTYADSINKLTITII